MWKIMSVLLVGIVLCGSAQGDYLNPPGWESNPYFTHQRWDFNTGANPNVPPDGGYVNPNGYPAAVAYGGTWRDDLGNGRQGGWLFTGIRPHDWNAPLMVVDIPNSPNPDLTKELWFQMTFRNNFTYGEALEGKIAAITYQGVPFELVSADTVQFDMAGGDDLSYPGASWWWRLTAVVRITPQPEGERIIIAPELINQFLGQDEMNSFILIDQIDVDTRCIPEPATMGLLGLGLLGVIRRKRA